jgi:hypothetical protein
MKGYMLKHIAFFSIVLTVASVQSHDGNKIDLSSEAGVIKDASEKIAQILGTKNGKVERIKYTYDPKNGNVTLETFYIDYRKAKDYRSEKLPVTGATESNELWQVLYKPSKNTLSLFCKRSKDMVCISSKNLPVPEKFKA